MLQSITTVDKYVFKFDGTFDDAKITLESSVITQDLTQYKLQDNHYKLDYFFPSESSTQEIVKFQD